MTAPTDPTLPTTKTRSRRALLAGALGGVGALAASAIGRVSPVRAEDGQPVLLGTANSATVTTSVTSTVGGQPALEGVASGKGVGVSGYSPSGAGVYAFSENGPGVWAEVLSPTRPAVVGTAMGAGGGVMGTSGGGQGGLPDHSARTGVFGWTDGDATSKGVFGRATEGTGLYGRATTGYALRGDGRVRFDRVSGVATIPAGVDLVTVSLTGITVTPGSFVLLTPKANIGGRDLWFTTNVTANTITIRMSSSRSISTKVAWLLLG